MKSAENGINRVFSMHSESLRNLNVSNDYNQGQLGGRRLMNYDRLFLESAHCTDSHVFSLDNFDQWFQEAIQRHRFRIDQIPFSELLKWSFTKAGSLSHDSGRFFSIQGISVDTTYGSVLHWSQPIINQPEVGFLGFIVKRIRGIPHFLMQAKMEPGNINMIQLAPTLQATRSNYMRVHEGKTPPFLEYFRDPSRRRRVLVDVLQSEQGGRFLRKRNRNMVVEINPEDLTEVSQDYIWLSLGQILRLLRRDNTINMDARTVLGCISFHRFGFDPGDHLNEAASSLAHPLHTMDEILTWFTERKCQYDLEVQPIPLDQVSEWQRDDYRIYHPSGDFFEVIAMRVEADNREVTAWTQPIIKPCKHGIIAMVAREINGVLHFLVQAKVEAGNFDVVEMAPTVQCMTGDYRRHPDNWPPFLDYVLNAPADSIYLDTLQSEEGGRFYREENRNMIVWADDSFPIDVPDNYMWISYTQLKNLIRFNNIVNIQARCLLSCIPPGLDGTGRLQKV